MEDSNTTMRNQRIIEHFQNSWQSLQKISPEQLAHISKFVIGLQEPYKNAATRMIAEYIVGTMHLHILALMTTFQNNAPQEDILPQECQETFEQVLPETFRIIGELHKLISVQSLDDLVALSQITGSLQTLSSTTSAEEAQSWIYELPTLYYRQLKQENLVTKGFIDWTQNEKNATVTFTIQASTSPNKPAVAINPENIHILGTVA